MEVIRLADEELAEGRAVLERVSVEVLAESRAACGGVTAPQLLVGEAEPAIVALAAEGLGAERVAPPVPVTEEAILWWKSWRNVLPIEVYSELRLRHHREVPSTGAIVRLRRDEFPEVAAEPWKVLADGGVDVRCEFHCARPDGNEVHVLVPDPERALEVLGRAGFRAQPMDYEGPRVRDGISWWGEWRPALAYAGLVQRPILMSFASPRVEQVPGVW